MDIDVDEPSDSEYRSVQLAACYQIARERARAVRQDREELQLADDEFHNDLRDSS